MKTRGSAINRHKRARAMRMPHIGQIRRVGVNHGRVN